MRRITDFDKLRRDRIDEVLKTHKQVVDLDDLDRYIFKDIKKHNKNLKDTEKHFRTKYKPFTELQEDVFASLYKYKPNMNSMESMELDFLFNHAILEALLKTKKYKELRFITRLQEIPAAIGTETFSREIEHLLEQSKEQQAAANALKDAMQKAEEATEAKEGEGKGTGQPGANGKKGKAENKVSLEEAKKKLEEARKKFTESTNNPEFKQRIGGILSKIKTEVQQASDFIEAWGLGASSQYTNSPYAEKMRLLDLIRNSSKLRQIAEMAGKMKMLCANVRMEHIPKGMEEIHDVVLGGNLDRIIPSEKMRLLDPIRKLTFMSDLTDGNLLQYDIKGKKKRGKGPIVMCIDESGSMSGLPEVWSKAVAMALLDIAVQQKRACAIIHFDSDPNPKNLKVHVFPKDEPLDLERLIAMAEHFSGGGTNFEPPLARAKDYVDNSEEFSKADIIFVTDGQAPIGNKFKEEYNKWKKEKNVRVFGVHINASYGCDSSMEEFCDSIRKIEDIQGRNATNTAISIFESVL